MKICKHCFQLFEDNVPHCNKCNRSKFTIVNDKKIINGKYRALIIKVIDVLWFIGFKIAPRIVAIIIITLIINHLTLDGIEIFTAGFKTFTWLIVTILVLYLSPPAAETLTIFKIVKDDKIKSIATFITFDKLITERKLGIFTIFSSPDYSYMISSQYKPRLLRIFRQFIREGKLSSDYTIQHRSVTKRQARKNYYYHLDSIWVVTPYNCGYFESGSLYDEQETRIF